MTEPSDFNDYAIGISDILESVWSQGFGAKIFNHPLSTNPYAVDSNDWREWLRGYESAENLKWQTIEVPDLPDDIVPKTSSVIQ